MHATLVVGGISITRWMGSLLLRWRTKRLDQALMMKSKDVESLFFFFWKHLPNEKARKCLVYEGVGKYIKSDRRRIGFSLLLMRIPNSHSEPPRYTFQKVFLCRLI